MSKHVYCVTGDSLFESKKSDQLMNPDKLRSGNMNEVMAYDPDDPYGELPPLRFCFSEGSYQIDNDLDKLFSLKRSDRAAAVAFIDTHITLENYGLVTDDHKEAIKLLLQGKVPKTGQQDFMAHGMCEEDLPLTGPEIARQMLCALLNISKWPEIAADLSANDFDILLIELLHISKELEEKDPRFTGQVSVIPQILDRICDCEKIVKAGGVGRVFQLAHEHGAKKKSLVPIQQALIMMYKKEMIKDEALTHLLNRTVQNIVKFYNSGPPNKKDPDDEYLNPLLDELFRTLHAIEDPGEMGIIFETPFFDKIFETWTLNRTAFARQRVIELLHHICNISTEMIEYLLREKDLLKILLITLSWHVKQGNSLVEDITCVFQMLCRVMHSEYARDVLLGRVPDKQVVGIDALFGVKTHLYHEKIGICHFVGTLVKFYQDDDVAAYIEQFDIAEYISELIWTDQRDTVEMILGLCNGLVEIRDHIGPVLGKVLGFLFSEDGYAAVTEICSGDDQQLAEMAEILKSNVQEAMALAAGGDDDE